MSEYAKARNLIDACGWQGKARVISKHGNRGALANDEQHKSLLIPDSAAFVAPMQFSLPLEVGLAAPITNLHALMRDSELLLEQNN